MTGSEKQIKWAQDIKAAAMKAIDDFETKDFPAMRAQAEKSGKYTPEQIAAQVANFERGIAETRAKLEAQTDAKWWIDRRANVSFKHWATA